MSLGIPDGTKKVIRRVEGRDRKFTSLIIFSRVVFRCAHVGDR